ncbi:hypothetical protein, conserved [Plasmodium gonderi]|uniref:3'-5' exonuclease domain-containing protein n=1 Tax=Plasmodium gonderi TaxID=77519 RepID=A0A1Y1JFE1_PLAGO|nr:hypothetical protein, conserved [Plasmodium gonderi]GAW79163.1 hypothetical protein, conserved [Plasmodium gonderi]
MKELPIEKELELIYEYTLSVEFLIRKFSDYIKRKKTQKKIIAKKELISKFILKYLNKNIPSLLSRHIRCVKNNKFYEQIFLCAFYHIIVKYVVYDPLFSFHRDASRDVHHGQDEQFEKHGSYKSGDNERNSCGHTMNEKNKCKQNDHESKFIENINIHLTATKGNETKEEMSRKVTEYIMKENIPCKELDDGLLILHSTYEQICDVIYAFSIICYLYEFHAFFKIKNIKILKNDKCLFNFFNWIYNFKSRLLRNMKIGEMNKSGKNDMSDANQLEETQNQDFSSNETTHFSNANENNFDSESNKKAYAMERVEFGSNNINKCVKKKDSEENSFNVFNNIFQVENEFIDEEFFNFMLIKRKNIESIFFAHSNEAQNYCEGNPGEVFSIEHLGSDAKMMERKIEKNKKGDYQNIHFDRDGNMVRDGPPNRIRDNKNKVVVPNVDESEGDNVDVTGYDSIRNSVKMVDSYTSRGRANVKNYDSIKSHFEYLYNEMKNVKTSKVYIPLCLYANYIFDFYQFNIKRKLWRILNFNLCFDEDMYESSKKIEKSSISTNNANSYFSNGNKNYNNDIKKKSCITFYIGGLVEFIDGKNSFERKYVLDSLKKCIDNELFNTNNISCVEETETDERKNKSDTDQYEYHNIFYVSSGICGREREFLKKVPGCKKRTGSLVNNFIQDEKFNYNQVNAKVREETQLCEKINQNDNRTIHDRCKKNENAKKKKKNIDKNASNFTNSYSDATIAISEFVNEYIYMFICYVCLNVTKLAIFLIDKYNISISSGYLDLSSYIYICQMNKMNSNILYFIRKHNIHHSIFSNCVNNRDLKENYLIYQNIEYTEKTRKNNDLYLKFLEDIVSHQHMTGSGGNKRSAASHIPYSNTCIGNSNLLAIPELQGVRHNLKNRGRSHDCGDGGRNESGNKGRNSSDNLGRNEGDNMDDNNVDDNASISESMAEGISLQTRGDSNSCSNNGIITTQKSKEEKKLFEKKKTNNGYDSQHIYYSSMSRRNYMNDVKRNDLITENQIMLPSEGKKNTYDNDNLKHGKIDIKDINVENSQLGNGIIITNSSSIITHLNEEIQSSAMNINFESTAKIKTNRIVSQNSCSHPDINVINVDERKSNGMVANSDDKMEKKKNEESEYSPNYTQLNCSKYYVDPASNNHERTKYIDSIGTNNISKKKDLSNKMKKKYYDEGEKEMEKHRQKSNSEFKNINVLTNDMNNLVNKCNKSSCDSVNTRRKGRTHSGTPNSIVLNITQISNINFFNHNMYPIKLNVVYNLYLNDILKSDARIAHVVDNCKGNTTLELELIKQQLKNGNVKYAIRLLKLFNYELLQFPNLFFYLNYKSYNYLLSTFDKKYIIYYLYDNPKYLKIYFSALLKKKSMDACLMALYFLYPLYISSEDLHFRMFYFLFFNPKKTQKKNHNSNIVLNDPHLWKDENENKGGQKNNKIGKKKGRATSCGSFAKGGTTEDGVGIDMDANSFTFESINRKWNYNAIYSFVKNECVIINDLHFAFKNEEIMPFDSVTRKIYKLSDLCKYFGIFEKFKKLNSEIIKNSFNYLIKRDGKCSCQKKFICINDLGASLKVVRIIESFEDFLILYEHIKKKEKVIFIDAEWKCSVFRENPIISIFQIALKDNPLSYIIDLKKISVENYEVNYYISDIFRDQNIIKIGVAFLTNDMLHFRKYYDIFTMLKLEKYHNILVDPANQGSDENQKENNFFPSIEQISEKPQLKCNTTSSWDVLLQKVMKSLHSDEGISEELAAPVENANGGTSGRSVSGEGNHVNKNKQRHHFRKNNPHFSNNGERKKCGKENYNLSDDISFKNIFPVNYFLKYRKNVSLIDKHLNTKCKICNKVGIYSCIHKYYDLENIYLKYYEQLKAYFPDLRKNVNYSVKIFGKALFPEKEVNKECQIINWNFRPLSSSSVEYAILDVLILKNFFSLIQTKLPFNIECTL